MSYVRWSKNSSIYIYPTEKELICCACTLIEDEVVGTFTAISDEDPDHFWRVKTI
jgi:hypothetical protein